jgi:hypothetical protein
MDNNAMFSGAWGGFLPGMTDTYICCGFGIRASRQVGMATFTKGPIAPNEREQ